MSLVELKHVGVVWDVEELAELSGRVFGLVGERFVAQFVVMGGCERGAGFATSSDAPFPPQGAGGDGVVVPGGEASDDAWCFGPVEEGERDVSTVADDVHDFRVGEEVVEGRDAAYVGRGLVADECFADALSVEVED